MPKTGRKRSMRFSSEEVTLPCEWKDCVFVDNQMHNYVNHISQQHMSFLIDGNRHCYWRNCECDIDTLEELRRHVFYHAFHTKIKCFGQNLLTRDKLSNCCLSSNGQNIIPELPEPFNCIWSDCQLIFENPDFFYRHLDSHAVSEAGTKEKCTCCVSGCNKEFSDLYKLKDHLRSHTQEKVIACPTCGGMFASRAKFVEHIERQTSLSGLDNSSIFSCNFCARKLPTKKLFQDHVRLHVNHYKCPYCDMTCPTPSALTSHVSYRHSDEKPYSCKYCEYKCKRNADLRKHLETHSMLSTLVCPDKNCSFSGRSSAYKRHIRNFHQGEEPAKYACHLCSKVTTRGNYLTKHFKVKHDICLPSGHCRFRYHLHTDGYYRVQTGRLESVELSETLLCDNAVIHNQNGDVNIFQSVTGNISVLQAVADVNVLQTVSHDVSILQASTSNTMSHSIDTTNDDSIINSPADTVDINETSIDVNIIQDTNYFNATQAKANNCNAQSPVNNADTLETAANRTGTLQTVASSVGQLQTVASSVSQLQTVASSVNQLQTTTDADPLQAATHNSNPLQMATSSADSSQAPMSTTDALRTSDSNAHTLRTVISNAHTLRAATSNSHRLKTSATHKILSTFLRDEIPCKGPKNICQPSADDITFLQSDATQSSKIVITSFSTIPSRPHSEAQPLEMNSTVDVDDPYFLEYFMNNAP